MIAPRTWPIDPTAPLLASIGDPAGIGPDIAIAAWLARTTERLRPFAVVGDPAVLAERAAQLAATCPIADIADVIETEGTFQTHLPVLRPHHHPTAAAPVVAGVPDERNGPFVIACIETAVELLHQGSASAVVTNPIAKHVLYAAGFAHPGHTEFLAALADARNGAPGATLPVMLLASDALNVVPLTIHIPLADVPAAITADLITRTVTIIDAAMRQDFAIAAPRIRVAGLNPHAGESGTIGREDADIIAPAGLGLRDAGIDVSGPVSADTMFHAEARSEYDVALTMYHDQGLIPIKTLAFDAGVNVTLGLPFIRTSPDHGTAFAIAGSGRARAESLMAALKLAARMASNRAGYEARTASSMAPEAAQ